MRVDPSATRAKVSNHIQTSAVLPIRGLLSIFNERARSITFPSEIKRVLKVYNITVKKVKSIRHLKKDDVAIVLIRKTSSLDYHWICYPVNKNIKSYYGAKKTRVVAVYLLKNNNSGHFLSNHFP